jgi:pyrroline-5-carboxylate reductase
LNQLANTKIAFIGGGNMASSIIAGLISNGFTPTNLAVSAPSVATRDRLQKKYCVTTYADNQDAAHSADIVILAVKPQIMESVAATLLPALKHQPLIISLAAGLTTTILSQWLGVNKAIVRCMPNTPSQLHAGAAGLYANNNVSETQKILSEQILRAVGIVEWVTSDDLIDAVTAVSGSGPAYYFLFMEIMQKVAQELGLDQKTAHNLTIQTALGAAKMAAESDEDPAQLRLKVTSKNGTTDRAITTFIEQGLEGMIRASMTGARDRGRELAHELAND